MRVNLEYLENKIYLDRTTFNYFVFIFFINGHQNKERERERVNAAR